MSAAIAPPTVTQRVPGTTAGNQPCGSVWAARAAIETPAPTVMRPSSRSKASIAFRAVMSSTRPPAFWAASPYARPRPRGRTPRSPGSASARATSAALRGRTTVATLRVARPQPVSARGAPSEVDGTREERDPRGGQREEHAVGEHELLGRAAAALVEEERVAQEEQHERHDRQLGEDRQRRVRRVERPQAVRGDDDRRGHRQDVAQVGRRVGGEGRARGRGSVAEHGENAEALARHDEQRPEARDDEEPLGERHADRDAARRSARDEAAGDRGEVEDRDVAQGERVAGGQRDVAEQDAEERPPERGAEHDAADDEAEAGDESRPRRQRAGGDGAPALARVAAEVLRV